MSTRRDWRAVIFDLWDTLVPFPSELIAERDAALAETLAVDPEELRSGWLRLEPVWQTGPLMPSLELLCAELGARDTDLEQLLALRLEYIRRALKPRREVIETLSELRRLGLRLALISNCSGDVPVVWGDTSFAGLFDATVFSCEAGLRKPDVRVYGKAASELRVPRSRCLFVGDGGSDELAGAARAGMTAVLLRTGKRSAPAAPGWTHEINKIPAVLSLLDRGCAGPGASAES